MTARAAGGCPALADPADQSWVLALHLNEADMRQVAAGVLPAWLPAEATRALVWFDEGTAAGVREQMRAAPALALEAATG